jgi:prephenate dehydrogenase
MEKSGPEAADGRLFAEKLVIITPTAEIDAERRQIVENYWRAIGARIEEMEPIEHDRVYALTSHLPHLLAFAYLQGVAPEHLEHTGGGFRDFSRIGASDPDMWAAIFELNKQALLPHIKQFQENLDGLCQAIESGNVAASRSLIESARTHRTKPKQ